MCHVSDDISKVCWVCQKYFVGQNLVKMWQKNGIYCGRFALLLLFARGQIHILIEEELNKCWLFAIPLCNIDLLNVRIFFNEAPPCNEAEIARRFTRSREEVVSPSLAPVSRRLALELSVSQTAARLPRPAFHPRILELNIVSSPFFNVLGF